MSQAQSTAMSGLNGKVYFYCCPYNSEGRTGYQHQSICLAEGLQALGVPFYSNVNYWQLHPDHPDTLFRHDPNVTPDDCVAVILNHDWMYYQKELPADLFKPDRTYITVFLEGADGPVTRAMIDPAFQQFDVILKSHFNSKIEQPENFVPWAFGLSNRILQATDYSVDFAARHPKLLSNFRVTQEYYILFTDPSYSVEVEQPIRRIAREQFYPQIQTVLPLEETIEDYEQLPLENKYDLMHCAQTGRRHHPRYYQRLLETAACSCFGGCLVESMLTQEPTVLWWDSWRLWEAMVSGCVAFHVDFEQYGIELPVMPQNWVHYIGIDLDNPQAVIERIKADPGVLAQVSQTGRQWAIENYGPIPTAQRLLELLDLLASW